MDYGALVASTRPRPRQRDLRSEGRVHEILDRHRFAGIVAGVLVAEEDHRRRRSQALIALCDVAEARLPIDRARVLESGTPSVSAVRLFELLPPRPIVTVASVMRLLGASKPTATQAVETLVAAGVLVEATGKKRGRSFAYHTKSG